MNFAEVERDYIRSRVLPDFEWVVNTQPSRINPLRKPLRESRLALVTTAGVHLDTDRPFRLVDKKGDWSWREIPGDAAFDRLRLSHVGYNTRKVCEDINCVFPLERLRELATEGAIGSVSPRHFSFMGYIPITEPLVSGTAPEVAQKLREDEVDLVLLAPA